ncbi:oligosaccharide flippase family protein [Salinisphaera sp. SPP-AMP-43]|uniref:oligosaccharide flippase family protein n=1 Tax=Salinisphaera sp. SPP-AMP-43 TaxID=3121288 RepID=UPI003C6E78B0
MLSWLSASLADALGRVLLKLATTIVLARWLTPAVFGEAALTIVVVSLIAIVVTAPFEEALAQQRIVRRRHFAAALGLTVLGAALLIVLVGVLAWGWAWYWPGGQGAQLARLVAGFSLILPAHATVAVFTALARRHRRFDTLAWANLAGDGGGAVVGLVLAVAGAGVWALLSIRLVSRLITAGLLVATSPARIRPSLARAPLVELGGFAGWFFVARCIDKATDAVFQGLVARLFGLEGLGYLNMALRIIEPIRSPTASVSHNIALSYFMRAQHTPARLRAAVADTVSQTALVLLPVYFGLAAVAPATIDLLAGPGWTAAGTIARGLAIAAGVSAVVHFLMTALAARGRAAVIAGALALELVIAAGALVALGPWGWAAIGAARVVSALGLAAIYLWAAQSAFGLSVGGFMRAAVPAAVSAMVMAGAIAALDASGMVAGSPAWRLGSQMGIGIVLFSVLVLLFHRSTLRSIMAVLGRTPRAAAG